MCSVVLWADILGEGKPGKPADHKPRLPTTIAVDAHNSFMRLIILQ